MRLGRCVGRRFALTGGSPSAVALGRRSSVRPLARQSRPRFYHPPSRLWGGVPSFGCGVRSVRRAARRALGGSRPSGKAAQCARRAARRSLSLCRRSVVVVSSASRRHSDFQKLKKRKEVLKVRLAPF